MTKLGIRYYDPTLGRFTQPDPTGQDAHFVYARNNPINYVDPSGADASNYCPTGYSRTLSASGTPLSGGGCVPSSQSFTRTDPTPCNAAYIAAGFTALGVGRSLRALTAFVGGGSLGVYGIRSSCG